MTKRLMLVLVLFAGYLLLSPSVIAAPPIMSGVTQITGGFSDGPLVGGMCVERNGLFESSVNGFIVQSGDQSGGGGFDEPLGQGPSMVIGASPGAVPTNWLPQLYVGPFNISRVGTNDLGSGFAEMDLFSGPGSGLYDVYAIGPNYGGTELDAQNKAVAMETAGDTPYFAIGTLKSAAPIIFFGTPLGQGGPHSERGRIDDAGMTLESLKTTGSAGSKNVVCVDTSTGRLYASSSGTGCAD
jgi:hypothetical protein